VTECYQTSIVFPSVKRRRVEAEFSGGDITSHAGIPLLAQVDVRLGLTSAVAKSLNDTRRQASCDHALHTMIKQRVYALALGHEDLSDHHELRHDPALQTAASTVEALASPSTLCRLEKRADRSAMKAIHDILLDQFILSHEKPPRRLIDPIAVVIFWIGCRLICQNF